MWCNLSHSFLPRLRFQSIFSLISQIVHHLIRSSIRHRLPPKRRPSHPRPTGFLGTGPLVAAGIAESALISVIIDSDPAAAGSSELTGLSVTGNSRFSASGGSGNAGSSVDRDPGIAASRRAFYAGFAIAIDSNSGSGSRPASGRSQYAR